MRANPRANQEEQNSTLHRFAHDAMATTFEVVIAGEETRYAEQAAAAVFAEIDRIENHLSRFHACSDVSQINRLKPGESMRVGSVVFECLEIASRINTETGGAFDVTVPAVQLDLGGIGKGHALDQAAEILKDWSIDSALIHGGTSTALAIGGISDGGWPLGVGGEWGRADKKADGGSEKIVLKDAALSGSGTEVKGHHILDPRTGRPASGHLATWVVCPSAAVADALSTAFMVMGTSKVERYCASHPEVSALVVVKESEQVPRCIGIGRWNQL